jgi:hypothetical protein
MSGIGPIAGVLIPVTEMDYDTEILTFTNVDKSLLVNYSEGTRTVESHARKEHRSDAPLMVRLALWEISTHATACKCPSRYRLPSCWYIPLWAYSTRSVEWINMGSGQIGRGEVLDFLTT